MGDMGDYFRDLREHERARRQAALDAADTAGWTQHTPYHYSRQFGRSRMEWWPSSGKARLDNRMIYGHGRVLQIIEKLERGQTP